jgi:fatty acid amide hydrolase
MAKDGPLVARLREAGAIVLGKTNVPQLLMGNDTDNPVFGRTRNPWNLERCPGGSSGGEAAIIAANGSALGLGSDIGGSIRLPAHACGIHSFKPTSGRLTMLGHAQVFAGQEAIICQPGPLARSTLDLQLAMKVLAAPGQEKFDPAVPPVPFPDPAAVSLSGLRVGIFTDNGLIQTSPALRRAVVEAGEALRERGVTVEEWTPPDVPDAMRIYLGLLFGDGMAAARRAVRRSRRDLGVSGYLRDVVRQLGLSSYLLSMSLPRQWVSPRMLDLWGQHQLAVVFKEGLGRVSTDAYWQLVERRDQYRARFISELDARRFDAVICPPDALPALTPGTSYLLFSALSYATLFNLMGMPAGVVAATRVRKGEESDRPRSLDIVERYAAKVENQSAGLPVGVQVAARHWREDVALALMAAIEEHFRTQSLYPAHPTIRDTPPQA